MVFTLCASQLRHSTSARIGLCPHGTGLHPLSSSSDIAPGYYLMVHGDARRVAVYRVPYLLKYVKIVIVDNCGLYSIVLK